MIIKTNLSYIFGPSATTVASIFMSVGIIVLFTTWKAIFVVLIGAFLYSHRVSIIDTENRRVKLSERYFGFIPNGKWINVDSSMSLGYKTISEGFRLNSLSNRHFDLNSTKFALILYDANDMPIMTLMKFDTEIDMNIQMEMLSESLQIPF